MSSIGEIRENIKTAKAKSFDWLTSREVYMVILIITVASLSYGLGRLSKIREVREPLRIENITTEKNNGEGESGVLSKTVISNNQAAIITTPVITNNATTGQYVGSKTSDKYHLPWCSGAKRIKEENKIWFASIADAEAKGYKPAANCPGL